MASEGIPAIPKLRTSSVLTWIASKKIPVSVHDVAQEFSITRNDSAQRLGKLHRAGAIEPIKSEDQVAGACAARINQERRKRIGKRRCGRAASFYTITTAGLARVQPVKPIATNTPAPGAAIEPSCSRGSSDLGKEARHA